MQCTPLFQPRCVLYSHACVREYVRAISCRNTEHSSTPHMNSSSAPLSTGFKLTLQKLPSTFRSCLQVLKWLYDGGALSFDDMTNLPKTLRAKLAKVATVGALEVRSCHPCHGRVLSHALLLLWLMLLLVASSHFKSDVERQTRHVDVCVSLQFTGFIPVSLVSPSNMF